MKSVVCPFCGARIKAARTRCLRCGEDLPAGVQEQSAENRASRQSNRSVLLVATAGGLVVLVLGIGFLRQPESSAPAASSAPVTRPAAATSAAPQSPAGESISPGSGQRFMDPGRSGNLAYNRGDFATALQQYQLAVAKSPDDAESLSNLGQVLTRLGRAQESLDYFQRAIKLSANRWAYHFNLAHAHGQLNDWSSAVGEYRMATDLFPDDYATRYNLALALHRHGQEQEAVGEFLRAIELAPGEPSFHLSLGLSYERLARSSDAVKSYRRYLELAPDAADAAKVKARIESLPGGSIS